MGWQGLEARSGGKGAWKVGPRGRTWGIQGIEDGHREDESLKARLGGTGSSSWTRDGWAGELDSALTLVVGYLLQVSGCG